MSTDDSWWREKVVYSVVAVPLNNQITECEKVTLRIYYNPGNQFATDFNA